MTSGTAFVEEVLVRSKAALSQLEQFEAERAFVNWDLPIPRPYLGSGEIRLVIIGQDSTVQHKDSRRAVQTVLNLEKPGVLRTYLDGLCHDLGLSVAKNVYATNACKNFFTQRPTTIEEVDVLEASAPVWLPVLKMELDQFPQAVVISLGQPVLSMLVKPGFSREMKHYWGYHPRWRQGKSNPMRPIAAAESTVGRAIFPFVHQPTIRGSRSEFYRVKRDEYLTFIREHSELSD